MTKWKFKTQDKHQIRNENKIIIDLHFHLGKQKNLRNTIKKLSNAVDVISITSRGHRFSNDFEYNFDSFVEQLKQEKIYHVLHDSNFVEIILDDSLLGVIKSQEIYTKEGFDVVVVGLQENFDDDVSIQSIVNSSKNSLVLLSSPFQFPNSLRTRSLNDESVREMIKLVDAIELHNQSLFFNSANRRAQVLSLQFNKSGISVSDQHLYSNLKYPLNFSGIIINKPQSKESFLCCLKNAIVTNSFENYSIYNYFQSFELLSLSFKELKDLFYGKKI